MKKIDEENTRKFETDKKWLATELEQRNKEIKNLKADLEKKDATIQAYMFNEGKAR